jgi:hypothetical protein
MGQTERQAGPLMYDDDEPTLIELSDEQRAIDARKIEERHEREAWDAAEWAEFMGLDDHDIAMDDAA